MDDKLNHYINSLAETPPCISERQIVKQVEQRRKKLTLILLAVAGLLWTLTFYAASFVVGREYPSWGIAMLAAISGGYILAGSFAGIVIKLRKVGI
jgi:hypothetical protein